MDKVELAKMLGLEHHGYGDDISVNKCEIEEVLQPMVDICDE